jgi:hypothetical protein
VAPSGLRIATTSSPPCAPVVETSDRSFLIRAPIDRRDDLGGKVTFLYLLVLICSSTN